MIVHGIPNDVPLKEGHIVGIDCGVLYKGYYGDAARTFAVGEVDDEAKRLLKVTEEALRLAVEQVRPGGRLSDIGHASNGTPRHVSSARVFRGGDRNVGTRSAGPNYGQPCKGRSFARGSVAIEPMFNAQGGVRWMRTAGRRGPRTVPGRHSSFRWP